MLDDVVVAEVMVETAEETEVIVVVMAEVTAKAADEVGI